LNYSVERACLPLYDPDQQYNRLAEPNTFTEDRSQEEGSHQEEGRPQEEDHQEEGSSQKEEDYHQEEDCRQEEINILLRFFFVIECVFDCVPLYYYITEC